MAADNFKLSCVRIGIVGEYPPGLFVSLVRIVFKN